MNNFIQRALSGTVFVLLLVGSIIWTRYSFGILFAVITAFVIHEFHKLTNGQENVRVNKAFAVIGAVIIFASSFLYYAFYDDVSTNIFLIYALFVAAVFIAELYRKQAQPVHNWAYFILGQAYIALPFALLNFILFSSGYQPLILLAVFITIWVNDTGAYITGITFGKRRLFERISPKKSWEGFFGGVFFSLISAYVFFLWIGGMSLIQWIVFTQIIVVFGTFGDLIESLLKRTLSVKDSGGAIPGHGGLLDRFDSMLIAVPVIFVYLQLITLVN